MIAAVLLPVLVPAVAAADDQPDSGQTVVGELVQAWPEYEDHDEAAARGAEGPLTWIETADGESVRVSTEDLTGYLGDDPDPSGTGEVPLGATVEVVVGEKVEDTPSVEDGIEPALEVLAAEVVEPAPAEPPVAAAASDVVTIVMMLPAGGVPEPSRTLAQVEAAVAGPVRAFWSEQTGGAVDLTVAPGNDPTWIQGSVPCSDYPQLWNEAAAQVSWTQGPGKHLLVYLPRNSPGCSYGLAQVGGSLTVGGKLYVTDVAPTLIAHELGHNFGLGHASAMRCYGAMEEFTSSCGVEPYDDWYDVMGVSWGPMGTLNPPHLARLGVLPAGQQQVITASDALNARYTLAPTAGRTGLRALKLVIPAGRYWALPSGAVYWLEYRTATAQDAWLGTADNGPALQQGVLLRRDSSGSNTSLLLDATPQSGWDDTLQDVLRVGVPVDIAGATFQITVENTAAGGATVLLTGHPRALNLPTGNWEGMSASGSTLTVGGWAFDKDSPLASIPVHVYVDGGGVPLTANVPRPDVGAAFPGVGDLHGFSWSGTVAPGMHSVCVYAIDAVVSSYNSPLGCRSIATQVTPPVANWELLSAAGSTVTVKGWTFDPDATGTANQVHVYIDGRAAVVTANGSRPDVGSALGVGASHGFSWSGSVVPGTHTVCVYAIDVDQSWRNTPLGCRSVATQVTPPVGNWEVLSAAGSTLTVKGWAFDPDATASASEVHVYVDGGAAVVPANGSRTDVGTALGVGDSHGFSWSGSVAPGVHTVCVYAIDVDSSWRHTPLGCRTITTQQALPQANWELLSVSGSTVRVKGWAIDPDDRTAAVPVHVYIDGGGTPLTADGSRPDVGSAFPGSGDDHGFDWSVSLSPGQHTVCVYAIDREIPARNVPLGCRSVRTT